MQICSRDLRSLSESLNSVRNNLAYKSSESEQVKNALGRISQTTLDEAAKASSLREALEIIADEYKQSESKVVEMAGTATSDAKNRRKNLDDYNKKSSVIHYTAFKSNEIIFLLLKYWNDPEKLREALQDHYMSYTAQGFLKRKEYSEATWNKASLEERKAMLTGLLGELNALMGLNVTTYDFSNLGGSTRGLYDTSTNTVTINLDYIDPANGISDSYMVMRTMIHEMRHAYQYAAVNNPDQFNVSAETRQQWADNFNDYKDADTYGYTEYVQQPIEYDAKRFAGQYNDIKGYDPTYKGTW